MGLAAVAERTFRQRYPKARVWLVGGGGVNLEEFFLRPATDWFA
jgi:hypothetical protein